MSGTGFDTCPERAANVFLTQDEDFLFGQSLASIVVVSRVRQTRRLADRIKVWRTGYATLAAPRASPTASPTAGYLTGVVITMDGASVPIVV